MTSSVRPTDDEARRLAQDLMATARFAALGGLAADGMPLVTRIGFALSETGEPVSLVSGLSLHTRALEQHPGCSLLIGEPGPKGDPLSHPRLSLICQAGFIPRSSRRHEVLAAQYLRSQPKAKLYLQLPDFRFAVFRITGAHLNGGFGKAFRLAPADLHQADG